LVGQALAGTARDAWVQARLARALAAGRRVEAGGASLMPAVRVKLPARGVDAVAVAPADGALALAPVAWRVDAEGPLLVAGHRDAHFAGLFDAAPGDQVLVHEGRGARSLVVVAVSVVDPDDASALQGLGAEDVVLVTCWPRRATGPAPQRLLVAARKKGTVPLLRKGRIAPTCRLGPNDLFWLS
jgi:LPXTG-site transpeptidase (sortase) family protein